MTTQSLAQIKALLAQILAAIAELEGAAPPSPPPDDEAPFGRSLDGKPLFAPAWGACTSMREAAEREGVANFAALIGGGIKPGAAQMYQDFRPNLRLIEDTVVALGMSPWGQDWLSHLENRATISQDYVRRFGFRAVTRKPDGTLVEVE